jgi:hypothetical protein
MPGKLPGDQPLQLKPPLCPQPEPEAGPALLDVLPPQAAKVEIFLTG